MADTFWAAIAGVIDTVRKTTTADELITAVKSGPDQGHGDPGAAAFFAGSGGDEQILHNLDARYWRVHDVKATYWWKATSKEDDSVVEYVEGDLYLR